LDDEKEHKTVIPPTDDDLAGRGHVPHSETGKRV
jgi:hypothetical protein